MMPYPFREQGGEGGHQGRKLLGPRKHRRPPLGIEVLQLSVPCVCGPKWIKSSLANVAKDYKSMSLAIIGVLLSLLCALWDKRTTGWWRSLLESLRCNESAGVQEGKLALAYRRYKYCNRTGWEKLTSPSKA